MKLKEIRRTSTFAWSPLPSLPLLATGTVAGALDESFSNNGQLEIWAPDFLDKNEFDMGGEGQPGPKASVTTSSRFNRLAWGYTDGSRERGVLVAGMENGELDIWDPSKIVANADPSKSLILRNKTHTGPVRGLDFNPIQTNLFASGAVNGEIYIWDLKDPSKPYSPGTRSTKLDEITALAWNHHVQYALAASSSTGYTVVWDLRGKREVAALAYGGGAGTLAGGMQGLGAAGLAVGGRRGMSDVAWHPDNATRLVTSSEDDTSPIIMMWDLRNARAPEKILTGHEKGVLSLSWCKQDADLLLSCGKDNRALCWNPQTSEIIGELPSADNWAFQVDWCPRNPDLFAAAFFDGTIGIHSIQSTNEPQGQAAAVTQGDAFDVFNQPGFSRASQATLSLTQPPKWLRRPTSASFGYGGKLVSVSNLPSSQGKTQSSIVHIRKVATEQAIVERAKELQAAIEEQKLNELAEQRSAKTDDEQTPAAESSAGWKALLSLFKANSRDELITLLGFSKAEIASRVAEAVEKLKAVTEAEHAQDTTETSPTEQDDTEFKPHEPVVSFAEPERESSPEFDNEDTVDASALATENTPSEVSAGAASDTTSATRLADGESTTTAPSLFGDEIVGGTPQTDAAADFFGSIGTARSDDDQHMEVPHHNYPLDSSVAATIGSRPSSVASESLKSNTFRIYPNDESETDRLVTKALVLGDFESAVSLCLSSDRFADAILFAVRGGPELLQSTQKAYFERRTTAHPYLRLFQSIVTNDLADIVQNADLQEWQETFVVLCTFAGQEDFSSLAEQLGQRLEFQSSLAKVSTVADVAEKAKDFRKNATLTYLAAGKLERLVNIWIEELAEEEKTLLVDKEHLHGSRYTAHAVALQTFIEKVTVFRSAINYEDTDLHLKPTGEEEEAEARTYKLAGLYDRYFEYADLLATQGLIKEAVAFLKLSPSEYHGSHGSHLDFAEGRERLLTAAGVSTLPVRTASLPSAPAIPSKLAPVASTSNVYAYGQYGAPQQQPAATVAATSVYNAYAQSQPAQPVQPSGPYAPPIAATQSAPQPYQSQQYQGGPYTSVTAYSQPPQPQQQHLQRANGTAAAPPPGPPPRGAAAIKRDNGGWNDAPTVSQRRTPSNLPLSKPAAITAPFPNSAPSPPIPSTPPFSAGRGHAPHNLPPPPRPGSVQRPPPPPQGQGIAPPPHMRPPSGPPGPSASQFIPPPPSRMMSPPHGGPGTPVRAPGEYAYPPRFPGQHAPPPPPGHAQGPYSRITPSPTFSRGTPPPAQGQPSPYAPPPQQGSFAPPPQQPQGPYPPQQPPSSFAPPPSQVAPRPGPPGQAGGPPPPGGPARGPASAVLPRQTGPPPPKYPPGDRSHIPNHLQPVYQVINGELDRLKRTTPPQQKRLVDDLERRINPLFDALNSMAAHDRESSLALHVELLTRGSLTDDIGLWMSGVKQLIMRL
ncbi:unnamed protein product [Somion occarium]|uniref:Protein transport protein SEC31 n=1 Tax=Somion occarium TaxID=3059160 RepID=A0ABP1DKX2_9APHY